MNNEIPAKAPAHTIDTRYSMSAKRKTAFAKTTSHGSENINKATIRTIFLIISIFITLKHN